MEAAGPGHPLPEGRGPHPACGAASLALASRTWSRPPLAPCPWRPHRFCCTGSHVHAHRVGPPCQVLVMIPRGGPWRPGTAPSVWAPFCCLGLFVEMAAYCEPGKSLTPSLPAWPCFPETRRHYLFSELTRTPVPQPDRDPPFPPPSTRGWQPCFAHCFLWGLSNPASRASAQ